MRDTSEIVIVSACRTPIGKFNGAFSSIPAHKLSTTLIENTIHQLNIPSKEISDVILGQVLTTGQGQNPARQAAINAKLPHEVSAFSVNMVCGSGLKAICMAYQSLRCGDSNIVFAGGHESMSLAPHYMHVRESTKLGDAILCDTILKDGLMDPFYQYHMGITAENVAKRWNINRELQDEFAYKSQLKCANAVHQDFFKEEIVPLNVAIKKESIEVIKDEFPRNDCTLGELKKLKPAFLKDGSGTVTAGNASGINDGAAIVCVMTLGKALEHGLKPMVRIVSFAESGVDPAIMGIAPVDAIKKAVAKAKWTLDEVDVFEINEAFAAQSVAVIKELGIPEEKVNPCGGAIALGHPIGASGARIVVTLIHTLLRCKTQCKNGEREFKGVASLCIGGGMGIAMCVETL